MFDIVPNAYTARWLFYTVLHGIFISLKYLNGARIKSKEKFAYGIQTPKAATCVIQMINGDCVVFSTTHSTPRQYKNHQRKQIVYGGPKYYLIEAEWRIYASVN